MATLFILISFVLNAVSLFAIILLFTRQNRLYAVKRQQEKLVEDMEEMMAAYLLEMKEENEQFIREFSAAGQMNSTYVREKMKTAQDEDASLSAARQPEEIQMPISAPSMQRIHAAKVYQSAVSKSVIKEMEGPEAADVPFAEEDQPDHIFILQKQGLTVDEIAEKLKKGKTEVELALKFASAGKNS
ncbi:hypothetical protein F9802_05025 [Bacillus aerolatus]|uniref:Swarming motility protein SwrB n=1 Tax=Bacillus aerolatus TaxID=2653354 RepID=A0A6I1FNT0_9BACI|nr:hypothetical protein [Bacillus aerolatus]KAB7708076.1 hypothetical protein F9802_05025 [Bacillus aerolatus]